jgi:hypothetical protein
MNGYRGVMSDLEQMRQAIGFATKLLRDELGPGGLVQDEPESVRATWMLAIRCLESAVDYPMIPLHFWRHPEGAE